ncbi:hypothetical protein [Tautonia plasticadhaerens]|uniref:hypothetical protein n=1 Tax=Tautonia plasticadhaerens TaxID=2527974 RepID=UPI0011A3F375|nr:hypothetical protein [Tautonia plasticadhaerens]
MNEKPEVKKGPRINSSTRPSLLSRDLRTLLSLAERYQEDIETSRRRLYMTTVISYAIMSLFIILFVFITSEQQHHSKYLYLSISAIIAVTTLASAAHYKMTKLGYDSLRRDGRALMSLIDLLREIEASASDRKNLTNLQRAELRIRLSRFDIGPMREPHNDSIVNTIRSEVQQ